MKVRIINGTYGLTIRPGVVKPITCKDGPIEVSENDGKWLVKQGIAEEIKEKTEIKVEVIPEENSKEQPVEQEIQTKTTKKSKKKKVSEEKEPFFGDSDVVTN